MVTIGGFLGKKLLKFDGASLRIRDDACEKRLAEAQAQILELSIRVARLEGAQAIDPAQHPS